MLKLYPKQLRERFIAALDGISNVEMSEGNPFRLKIGDRAFVVFIKSLSPGYFKGSPDVSRIQLPILRLPDSDSNATFIALGYDEDNRSFVAWNPRKLAKRLNARENVSLYARVSIQKLPRPDVFNVGMLTSGERFLAFPAKLLATFFEKQQELFNDDSPLFDQVTKQSVRHQDTVLKTITDPDVLAEINPLLRQTRILDTASTCYARYSAKYPAMTFSDWISVAKTMHEQLGLDLNS